MIYKTFPLCAFAPLREIFFGCEKSLPAPASAATAEAAAAKTTEATAAAAKITAATATAATHHASEKEQGQPSAAAATATAKHSNDNKDNDKYKERAEMYMHFGLGSRFYILIRSKFFAGKAHEVSGRLVKALEVLALLECRCKHIAVYLAAHCISYYRLQAVAYLYPHLAVRNGSVY